MYPPTLSNLHERLQDYPAYNSYSDARLQIALDAAQAELESAVPAVTDVALNASADRMAYTICLDLAVWHLKRAVERTEDGDLPMSLWRERQDLNRRLEMLARMLDMPITVAPMERLEEEPALPK